MSLTGLVLREEKQALSFYMLIVVAHMIHTFHEGIFFAYFDLNSRPTKEFFTKNRAL